METQTITPEEQIELDKINSMSHIDMCRHWRFDPVGHPYHLKDCLIGNAFYDRLFNHFGGFTPEISKLIGWGEK